MAQPQPKDNSAPKVSLSVVTKAPSPPASDSPDKDPSVMKLADRLTPMPSVDRSRDVPRIGEGDPFRPHKILNHFDRIQEFVEGKTVIPVTVEIDPSNICNHRCEWCVSIEAHTGEKIGYDCFQGLVEELAGLGVKSVVLKGGGEPTVHPQINEMLDAVKDAGLDLGLITNGSLPHKRTADAILRCADWVRVSLDAANAHVHQQIHGTKDFHKIIRHVEYLATNTSRTLLGLNFVAEPRNHDQILSFAQMGKSLAVAYVNIRCVFDRENPLTEEVRAVMRQQAAAAKAIEDDRFKVMLGDFTESYLTADADQPFPYKKCLGPNMVGVVGADSEVYACCFLRGNMDFSFGNLEEQTFDQIWRGKRRQQVMQNVYDGKCGRVCMGGMTANRYNIYNQILNYLMLEEKQHVNFV